MAIEPRETKIITNCYQLRALINKFFAAKLIRLYSGSELVFFVLLANTFFPPPS